jgi:hypothetical protein
MAVGDESKTGGGKVEISSLPGATPSLDLSAGKAPDVSGIVEQDIKDRIALRTFQTHAFYGAGVIIVCIFASLLAWLFLLSRHIENAAVNDTFHGSIFIAPVVVIATLGALLTLALLKFAFRPANGKEDESSSVSMIQALGTQALEIAKAYFGKKD